MYQKFTIHFRKFIGLVLYERLKFKEGSHIMVWKKIFKEFFLLRKKHNHRAGSDCHIERYTFLGCKLRNCYVYYEYELHGLD